MILHRDTDFSVTLPVGKETDATILLAWQELKELYRKRFGPSQRTQTITVMFSLTGKDDLYSVIAEENSLKFLGSTPLHLLYGVYEFAERCLDYCFFEPGSDLIASAEKEVLLLPGELIRSASPQFQRRGFIQEFPFNRESLSLADWMAKNRLNYLLTWMKHYDAISLEVQEAFRLRGVEIESGHHNFNYWIPASLYAESHPEFFAWREGARIKPSVYDGGLLLSEQLCTTNAELRQEIVRRMIAYTKKHPELKVISLIPNDGFGWCECERCSQLYDQTSCGELYSVSQHVFNASAIYQDLIDDVSSQLRQQGSTIRLTFCAYVNYAKPAPGFRLKENLSVHFAPYWRCVNHNIGDSACEFNAGYARDLQAWNEVKDQGEIFIYEYLMGINLYVSLPNIFHERIFDEADEYSQMGADGYLTQFHLCHWMAYGINYYMMAKALWGCDQMATLDEFFRKIFGRRSEEARQFYQKLASLQMSAGSHLITYPRALFMRTKITDFREAHQMAVHLAMGAENDFVRRLPLWTDYLVRFKELFDLGRQGVVSREEIEAFRDSCRSLESQDVLLFGKLEWLLNAWIKAVDEGREWLHFNIDWEDDYVRRHDKILSGSPACAPIE